MGLALEVVLLAREVPLVVVREVAPRRDDMVDDESVQWAKGRTERNVEARDYQSASELLDVRLWEWRAVMML